MDAYSDLRLLLSEVPFSHLLRQLHLQFQAKDITFHCCPQTNIQNHRLIPSKKRIQVHFLNIHKYPVCSPANGTLDCPVLQTDDP